LTDRGSYGILFLVQLDSCENFKIVNIQLFNLVNITP